MTQWVKLSEKEWAKVPDGWSLDQIKEALKGQRQTVSSHAAANLERMSAGKDIPPNTNLATPEDPGYGARVGRILGESAQQIGTGFQSYTGSPLQVMAGMSKAALSPALAGLEEYHRWAANDVQGIRGPEVEQTARGFTNLDQTVIENLAGLATGGGFQGKAKPVKGVPGPKGQIVTHGEPALDYSSMGEDPAMQVVQTPQGPVRQQTGPAVTMKTPEGTIEQNPPGVPEKQIQVNATVSNPSDPVTSAKEIAANVGIPEPKVTVGETPISSSFVDEQGTPHMDLAEGTPDEIVHEAAHVKADIDGTPHPPEDNNAIIDEYLEGTTFKNREREWSTTAYDPDTDMYTATDEATGVEGQFSPESIAKGDPVQPKPSRQAIKEMAARKVAAEPQPAPVEDAPIEIPEEYKAKIAAKQPVKGPVLPEQPEALTQEQIRSNPPKTAGVVGPKEAALADEGVAPEWDTPPDGTSPLKAKKGQHVPTPDQPLHDTPPPKNAKERYERSLYYKTVDKITRAWQVIVTSRPATASRIFFDNQIRVAIDAVASRSMKGFTNQLHPGQNARLIEDLKGAFPDEGLDRFGLDSQVYHATGKVGSVLGYAVKQADVIPKEAVFVARLERNLANRGISLSEIREKGQLTAIKPEDLADSKAVGEWVGMSANPEPNTPASWAVKLAQDPHGRLFVGFGRMVYNRILSGVHQNPLQWLKIASPKFRAALAAGNPDAIRTAILPAVGMASVGAGYMAAKRGENDPQTLKAGMSKVDLGASYLFPMYAVGHALGRIKFGEGVHEGQKNINQEEITNIWKAYTGIPGAATTALGAALDFDMNAMKEAGKNWVGGFSSTFSVLHNIVAVFDKDEAKIRDTKGSNAGPFLKNIPYASQTLPEYKSTSTARPVVQEHPLAEAAGLQIRQGDTKLQDEMRRLGIRVPSKISDDPAINRKFQEGGSGEAIENAGNKVMAMDSYKSGSDAMKHLMLSRAFKQVIRALATAAEPVKNKDVKQILKERAVQ